VQRSGQWGIAGTVLISLITYIDPGNDRNEQRAIARIERILTRCGYLVMRNDKELHVMRASWLNDND